MKGFVYKILLFPICMLLWPCSGYANKNSFGGWGHGVLQDYRQGKRGLAFDDFYNDKDTYNMMCNFLDKHHTGDANDTLFFIYSWNYPYSDSFEILYADTLWQCNYGKIEKCQTFVVKEGAIECIYGQEYINILQKWDTTVLSGISDDTDDGAMYFLTRMIYSGGELISCESCSHYSFLEMENDNIENCKMDTMLYPNNKKWRKHRKPSRFYKL